MTTRIVTGANGRKYITNEPLLHPPQPTRNEVLEEVAKEFDKMPFGDTSASFARYVRDMKK
jgi:hypothetical protein